MTPNPSRRAKRTDVFVKAGSAVLAGTITVAILKSMLVIAAPWDDGAQGRLLARAASGVLAR